MDSTEPNVTPFNINEVLKRIVDSKASDLHLSVGCLAGYRIDGKLVPLKDYGTISSEMLQEALYSVISEEQKKSFEKNKELDFSYSIPQVSRFRGNLLYQRNTLSAVFRVIPAYPPRIEEMNFPPIITTLCNKPRGLVLVTGPTGSGKSTTLASMIDYINRTRSENIITIEDPIEFLHKNHKSMLRQRELGNDTLSFSAALKHVLRQDPDVILVGEMRDLETISLAITAAETGHLVFATLHTTSTSTTIDRIIDVFPPNQQAQVRMQLSTTLEGIICQTLIPKKSVKGRACAMEILVGTMGVRNLIREGKTHMIINMLQAGVKDGMQTLNMALHKLIVNGDISMDDGLMKSSQPDELRNLIQGKACATI
jgi:twitching motility protein PilT